MKKVLVLKSVLLILCISILSIPAFAAKGKSPEQVTLDYFNQVKSGDMTGIAQFMHESEMKKFQEMMSPVFDQGMTMSQNPQMMEMFLAGEEWEKVKASAPKDFFTRFMQWVAKLNPMLNEVIKNANIETVGHVKEENRAHVVYRMETNLGQATITKMAVLSLMNENNEWKLMLTGEIEGMAQMLQAQMNARQQQSVAPPAAQ